ncbi:MAG TPA: hypothetical protein VFX98_19800, partial [Longimicrobiaceae bacterium]|nr:hypothetical protein [Longimicrobiaceae bacterium]
MSTLAGRPLLVTPSSPAPPVEALVARVRGAWRRSVLLRAAVTAPALLVAAAVLLAAIDLLFPLRAAAREILRLVPLLVFGGYVGWAVFRVTRTPPARSFALLAEERVPALENRLVTALELGAAPAEGPVARAFLADAARRLSAVDLRGVSPARLRAPALLLGGAAGVIALFALVFPGAAAQAWERWTDPRDAYESAWREARAEALPTVPTPPVPGFDELRWRVEPPAYSGLAPVEGRGGEPAPALPGSRIRLRSRFADRW